MLSPRLRRPAFFAALAALWPLSGCTAESKPGVAAGSVPGQMPNGSAGSPSVPDSQGLGTVAIQNAQDKAISRLTNAQFIQSASVLLGDAAVVGAEQLLPEQDRHGAFRNTGYAQQQPFDLVQGYDVAASSIVDHVPDWAAFHQKWGGCTEATCLKTFVRNFTEAAFRRPTTDAEVAEFQPILDASAAATLSYDETVKLLVRATLQAPEFLYLFEDEALNDFQLAARLSFFVTDGPPDAPLYAAAKAGGLHAPGGLDAQIDRLLAQNVSRFAGAFAFDYLDLRRATTRNLTADEATVRQLMASAVDSMSALVEQNRPISTILTLDTFVTNPVTASWINGAPSTATSVKPNPNYPFMGLLTHPATLMSMSNAVFGSTVSRGTFIANQMLCIPPTPPPPPGIQQTDLSSLLPPDPTQRDEGEARLADARCQGCHAQFESYAFAFNKWGGDGQFKPDPRLKDGGPVKTGLGEIAFAGFADFLPKLAGSNQFQHCVADQLIRYGLQHTEYPPELVQAVLDDAQKLDPNLTFRSLMKALVRQNIRHEIGTRMKYRHVLNRRTCLRGGAIALGLPFLDCMLEKSVFGAPPEAPVSVISLMHGLGTSDIVLNRGLEGTLRYYKPLLDAGKLSIFTNIDMSAAADQPVVAQHHYGQPYLFSGFRTEITAGFNVIPQGPSLQYAIMKQAYPQGSPTLFKVMDCGIYFRRGINYQYQRIYDEQGKNAADFEDLASPVDMFEKVFGMMPAPIAADPKARAARSIMDYLVPAYQKYTGAGSPLPARDIAVLKNHLDRVRQLEQAVYGGAGQMPTAVHVTAPNPPNLKYKIDGSSCGDPANVYRVSATDFETAYQIMADLFVAGLQSDYYRFGNLSFDSGGGHTHFTGPSPNPDDAGFTFNGNPHATYHMWNPNDAGIVKTTTGHNFFVHRNLAQALSKLDSKDFLGPNGKSVLDNTLVLVGSEVGTNHDVTRMFHGIAGGDGRFKMGLSSNERIKAIELYSALGKTYGLPKVGDGRDYKQDATAILA